MYYTKQATVGAFTVKVEFDEDPESPRSFDNLGTIWGEHRRYNLNDKGAGEGVGFSLDDCTSWDNVKQRIERKHKGAVVLPVFMYDHSGQRLSVESFIGRAPHAQWDSGQYGVIYALPAAIRQWFGVKKLTQGLRDKARDNLRGEIEAYDKFISGQIYRFVVEDEDGDEVEGCGGFYDEDECLEEGKSAAEALAA